MKIRENIPISELTTMRLGGQARFVVEITDQLELPTVFQWIKGEADLTGEDENGQEKTLKAAGKIPYFVLGGGANTIGRDEGFDGVIILMRNKGMEIFDQTSDYLIARSEAGETWDDFVKFTVEHDLSGIECLAKIPGTAGAAPIQNIGAYGQEIVQVIDHAEVYDTETDDFFVFDKDDMRMSYRSTVFNSGRDKGRYIITAMAVILSDEYLRPPFYASLKSYLDQNLEKSDLEKYEKDGYPPEVLYRAVSNIRGDKLPDPKDKASSGSFFKNIYFDADDTEGIKHAEEIGLTVYDMPDGRKSINSGALIEMAGLKGELLHGMRVSDKAALILINESAKNYQDLAEARQEIRDKVAEEYGFELEQEPVEIA